MKAIVALFLLLLIVAAVVGIFAGLTLAIVSAFTAYGFWAAVAAFAVTSLAQTGLSWMLSS